MPDESSAEPRSLLSRTRDLLRQYDLHARKSLGQHFLVNSGILDQITGAAELSPRDIIIEVGPGLGMLTRELVELAGYVIAVELDPQMIDLLEKTLADRSNFSLVHRDILEVEPQALITGAQEKLPPAVTGPRQYKVVANLPYYITQPVIRHFCEAAWKPQMMVIMVQKEVARNIVARPGDLSILAVAVQFYGRPQIAGYVPASNFYPPPKVDSAILKIEMFERPPVNVTSEAHFFKVVRAGFSAARKQVANSLARGLDIPKAEVLSLMQPAGIDPQKRAEALTLEEWARLEKVLAEAGR